MSEKNMDIQTKDVKEKYTDKWKKLIGYYKPYKKVFWADMFFALLGAVTTLILPLIIRYITNNVIYRPKQEMMTAVLICAGIMIALVLIQ